MENKQQNIYGVRVVCINTEAPRGSRVIGIEKGKSYKIKDVLTCLCGETTYLLDGIEFGSNNYCSVCDKELPFNAFKATRFILSHLMIVK